MRITELFTAQSIALDEALQTQEEILSRLVELQATHGNITDKEAYKKALYAREAEGSTYVDNGITVPHAKINVVTRPSLAALRLSTPVQYNAEDEGATDLLFAIAAPENGSLHVDMLARMMQMLMNEDFVEKLKAAKTPAEFLDCIDAQEEAQFGAESFTQQEIPQSGYRILAVTACVNGIAHTYMAAEALTKAGDKLGLPTKVETNGSDGAKNILTREEITNCDGIIVAAEKKVETARFDGKPVLFTRVDDGIHKPEELIKKIVHGEVPVYHAEGGAQAAEDRRSEHLADKRCGNVAGLFINKTAQQRTEHASGESHETAQAEQIADKRGDKRRTDPVCRAEQHRAYDVHHMLNRRALAAEHGKGKQTSHNCNGAQDARRRKLFGIDFFHFYFSFEIRKRLCGCIYTCMQRRFHA